MAFSTASFDFDSHTGVFSETTGAVTLSSSKSLCDQMFFATSSIALIRSSRAVLCKSAVVAS